MNRLCCLLLLSLSFKTTAGSIILHKKNAEVWYPHQELLATLEDLPAAELRIHHGDSSFTVPASSSSVRFWLTLHPGANRIWLEAGKGTGVVSSDTITLTLMYDPSPAVKPFSEVKRNSVILNTEIIENPYGKPLTYWWVQGKQNPAAATLRNRKRKPAKAKIPREAGKYYFDLAVIADRDTSWFQTYVTRTHRGLSAFSIGSDYGDWIDDAIIYEITPYKFMPNATFDDITEKLPEIKLLGVNTLWIQPLFKTREFGQGYDVIDYFTIRSDLGTGDQLQHLIKTAKDLNMRVIFDMVPNHTSIDHRYAKEAAARGKHSHYDGYYQHENDGALYSSSYHQDENGFIYYFWNDLVNLNYDSEEVQRWMIEACKYWLLKYDLDGYRFDAVWGVNARNPSFGKKLQTELKSIRPDILLLAEDKGSDGTVYDKGFDVAYDWTADTSWISQWSWQYDYSEEESLTIFKYPDSSQRSAMLADAIFRTGDIDDPKLRFMENNDLPRFIEGHTLEQTRMAAGLLFSLPGIPMLYNGQEIGRTLHPYSKGRIFKRGQTIRSQDSLGLFSYYQQLAHLRLKHPSLRNGRTEEVVIPSDRSLFAFRRSNESERILVVLNMDSRSKSIGKESLMALSLEPGARLLDVLSGSEFTLGEQDFSIPMDSYSVRWLLVKE